MKVPEIAMKIPSIPMVPKSDGDRRRASNKPNRKFTIWVENFSMAVHLTPDIVSDFRLSIHSLLVKHPNRGITNGI